MAPRDREPPPTRLWPECARSADSGSPLDPWVSGGGELRSARIRAIRTRGAQTRGPREIEDFVGWEMARVWAGRLGVRDPATLLQRPPRARPPPPPPPPGDAPQPPSHGRLPERCPAPRAPAPSPTAPAPRRRR